MTTTTLARQCDALGDFRRVAIVERLAAGPAIFADLPGLDAFGGSIDAGQLCRYHLKRLLIAGIITCRRVGNPGGGSHLQYTIDRDVMDAIAADLARIGGRHDRDLDAGGPGPDGGPPQAVPAPDNGPDAR